MRYFETRALLLDMDGTIIDSRVQVERAWSAWCARRGFVLAEILDATHGVRTEDSLRRLAPDLDIAAEVAWIEALDAGCDGLRAVAGVGRFLASLPGAAWALVTSATRPVLEARFAHCGLALPAVVVSSETVGHGKPAPDPYLQAAAKLGVAPRDCIVFEDAPAGLASALAAGCRVVLVGGLRSTQEGVIAAVDDYAQIELTAGERLRLAIPEACCAASPARS